MPGWRNEVKASVNAIVLKLWVTLDHRFLRKDVVELALNVGQNLRKAKTSARDVSLRPPSSVTANRNRLSFIVDRIREPRAVHKRNVDDCPAFQFDVCKRGLNIQFWFRYGHARRRVLFWREDVAIAERVERG